MCQAFNCIGEAAYRLWQIGRLRALGTVEEAGLRA
jgi:hypothetical protein